MCGRYALATVGEALLEAFNVTTTDLDLGQLAPRYNIAPTQPVLAVRPTAVTPGRELVLLQWGLIPSWAKDTKMGARLINARAETVAEKPAFRAAFKRRRCIIPADGFFEWQKQNGTKQPMYIHAADQRPLGLAGLWEIWHSAAGDQLETCTILTTTPNSLLQPIHDRMPVILEPSDYDQWLTPDDKPENDLHLLRPFPAEKMRAYPISNRVNSPANDDSHCIAPLA
jgi:putative SOS response-associated peptidase YedK